ncbi:hypothetical protein PFISCL1PPCAC_9021, partial [Pristionchus fissidentatus]
QGISHILAKLSAAATVLLAGLCGWIYTWPEEKSSPWFTLAVLSLIAVHSCFVICLADIRSREKLRTVPTSINRECSLQITALVIITICMIVDVSSTNFYLTPYPFLLSPMLVLLAILYLALVYTLDL